MRARGAPRRRGASSADRACAGPCRRGTSSASKSGTSATRASGYLRRVERLDRRRGAVASCVGSSSAREERLAADAEGGDDAEAGDGARRHAPAASAARDGSAAGRPGLREARDGVVAAERERVVEHDVGSCRGARRWRRRRRRTRGRASRSRSSAGRCPVSSVITQAMASSALAAPMQWPSMLFMLEMGTRRSPKTSRMTFASAGVVVLACRCRAR